MSLTFSRDPLPRIAYAGDGIRTSFPFPFPVIAPGDLQVFVDASPATGFSVVDDASGSGGEVVFLEPPASGSTVTLLRRTESVRAGVFVDGAPFRASAVNAELDRLTLLIQEDREEHGRSLRAGAFEGGIDFCLPTADQRANRLLGFGSSGEPMAFGLTEVPDAGDASGVAVTASGATTARFLGQHLADRVNVRDFGAIGDGVADDAPAFQAAVGAAGLRKTDVYVPASQVGYLIGSSLVLDGVGLIGDGPGSLLKLGMATGAGIDLQGESPRLRRIRVLGPSAPAWPSAAGDVDLTTVALDGVRVATLARGAIVDEVEVAACNVGLAIEGGVCSIQRSSFAFGRTGIEVRATSAGAIAIGALVLDACTTGARVQGAAGADVLTVHGGAVGRCGIGVDLEAPAARWRSTGLSGIDFDGNVEVDVSVGPRHTADVRGCHVDRDGKRRLTAIDVLANGETTDAPTVSLENIRAGGPLASTVTLSGGTNLNLLQAGDLIVLAGDADDIDSTWTALKAARGGIVHKVVSQTTGAAEIRLAPVADRPLPLAADTIRVVGRSGTATVGTAGALTSTTAFTWLRVEDYCRVLVANDPTPASRISLLGPNAVLHRFPGYHQEPASLSGVELEGGRVNGAHLRLITLTLPEDTATSFTPDASIGTVLAFGHNSLGDPMAAQFTYRTDALGFVELLAVGQTTPSAIEVTALVALTGTTGTPGKFTFSAHSNGKIYVENRMTGSRTVSLLVIGGAG